MVNIKDILERHERSKEVTSGGVDDTLGLQSRRRQYSSPQYERHVTHLSSGSRGVEDEEGVFGANDLRRAVRLDLLVLLVPPLVPSLDPLDVSSSPLEDEAVLNERALGEGGVDDRLGRDGLASTLALIGGDDDARLGVLDSVAEGLGGESSEDDRVDGSETGASKEGDGSLGDPANMRCVSTLELRGS